MNESAFPKLSIITINLNNKEGLKKTIESVINQTFKNFEYIVIDGASTDGSVDVIKNYQDQITHWVSEKDNGIYNAMNKGIKVAKGEYLYFLNTGDVLHTASTLQNTNSYFGKSDILYGFLEIKEPDRSWIKEYPSVLTFRYFWEDSLPHSGAVFIRRSCFKGNIYQYDESLKIVADWKWFLIGIFKEGYSYLLIDKIIGIFDYGKGISSTPANWTLLLEEKETVLKTEFKYLYSEIKALNDFQNKYVGIVNSRYFKVCFKVRSWINKIFRR